MTNSFHQVCVLLGSNILPELNLPQAIVELGQQMVVTSISSVWQTEAVGSSGPDFLNVAILGFTRQHPTRLKTEVLRPLEAKMGRIRTGDKNAARTIDLDIVVFDQHPMDRDLWKYAYVAVPVAELLPELTHPITGVRLRQAAEHLAEHALITPRSDLSLPAIISQPSVEPASLVAPNAGPYMS